jgi:hypothetical protein
MIGNLVPPPGLIEIFQVGFIIYWAQIVIPGHRFLLHTWYLSEDTPADIEIHPEPDRLFPAGILFG